MIRTPGRFIETIQDLMVNKTTHEDIVEVTDDSNKDIRAIIEETGDRH